MKVVLAEWLFESVKDHHVLTLDKRYFDIPGAVGRWLYLYAQKATGGPTGRWKETFRLLYGKSASQQEYKHFAHALRKLIAKNDLPGLILSRHTSASGEEMLGMERKEKTLRQPRRELQPELPLQVVEELPRDEVWENAMESLRKQVGAATANSWFKPLHLVSREGGVLTLQAPTRFIANWVESHYVRQIRAAWEALGHEITEVRFVLRGVAKVA